MREKERERTRDRVLKEKMQIEEGSAGKKMYPQEMEKERERAMCNQQEMGESGWGGRRRTDVVMRCHVTLASFDLKKQTGQLL